MIIYWVYYLKIQKFYSFIFFVLIISLTFESRLPFLCLLLILIWYASYARNKTRHAQLQIANKQNNATAFCNHADVNLSDA